MNLTRSFTLDEMRVSQTAARLGLDNTPSADVIAELHRLCETILQPLREHFRRPVVVSSGYRSPAVNRAVGGAPTSDHQYGRAADIIVPGMSVRELALFVSQSPLPYDQCISEFDRWVHVSIAPPGARARRQALTASRAADGRTVYTPGIA